MLQELALTLSLLSPPERDPRDPVPPSDRKSAPRKRKPVPRKKK